MTFPDWAILVCAITLGAILMRETGRLNRLSDERDALLAAHRKIKYALSSMLHTDLSQKIRDIAEKAIVLCEEKEKK